MNDWITFLVIMALGQFSPGPDMVILTRTALTQGRLAAWVTAGGIASGLMVHSALAVAGLAVVFETSRYLTVILCSLAACYLTWLGWKIITSARAGNCGEPEKENYTAQPLDIPQLWWRGFICNILNPKVVIFLASVITPFLDGEHGIGWPWLLWVTIWVQGFLLWGIWGSVLQVSKISYYYRKVAPQIDVFFGLALWGVAFLLIYSLR